MNTARTSHSSPTSSTRNPAAHAGVIHAPSTTQRVVGRPQLEEHGAFERAADDRRRLHVLARQLLRRPGALPDRLVDLEHGPFGGALRQSAWAARQIVSAWSHPQRSSRRSSRAVVVFPAPEDPPIR